MSYICYVKGLPCQVIVYQGSVTVNFDNILTKFSFSRQEIFISDNRAHCVKVFDYEGNYLRQIGGEGEKFFTCS